MNCLHHIICFYQMNSLLLRKKAKIFAIISFIYEIGFFSFHLVSFVSYLFRFDIATWAKDANYANNRKIIIYKIQAYQMLCFFNFFYAIRLLQSIFFCLHHDTNAIYLVSYFLSLYSEKINRRGRKIESEKNQKQNKTVYRLCSYRLVICFIGSAIAHGALKAADILLTYVFM